MLDDAEFQKMTKIFAVAGWKGKQGHVSDVYDDVKLYHIRIAKWQKSYALVAPVSTWLILLFATQIS